MNFQVETISDYRIAYVRQVGPYGPNNIQAMEEIKRWAKEKNLLNESAIILGIPQDNPETTLPENCRYDACIAIGEDERIDDAVSESKFSGGKYIIFKIKHTTEAIQQAWSELFIELQNNRFQIDTKPIIERYSMEMIDNHYCEICVPIKP